MTNILDLAREQMNQVTPPTPTEKAQIVFVHIAGQLPTIVRYNTTKKAEKDYNAVLKAWDLCKVRTQGGIKTHGPHLHDMNGDMFICAIDLTQVACICYVDQAKRAKFVPVS